MFLITYGPFPKYQDQIIDGIKIYSDWTEWGPCSACESVENVKINDTLKVIGERRRFGRCKVKLANGPYAFKGSMAEKSMVSRKYFYIIMNTYMEGGQSGLPCNSSLFAMFKHLDDRIRIARLRPNEIRVENCIDGCNKNLIKTNPNQFLERFGKSSKKENKSFTTFKPKKPYLNNLGKELTEGENDEKDKTSFLKIDTFVNIDIFKKTPSYKLSADAGDSIDIYCPGLEDIREKMEPEKFETQYSVRWQNNGTVLHHTRQDEYYDREKESDIKGEQRLTIDDHFTLSIVNLHTNDSGEYSCWNILNNKLIGIIKLNVNPSPVMEEILLQENTSTSDIKGKIAKMRTNSSSQDEGEYTDTSEDLPVTNKNLYETTHVNGNGNKNTMAKYNIWSDVLINENLSSDFVNINTGNNNVLKRNKQFGPESYFVTSDMIPIIRQNAAYKQSKSCKNKSHGSSLQNKKVRKQKINSTDNITNKENTQGSNKLKLQLNTKTNVNSSTISLSENQNIVNNLNQTKFSKAEYEAHVQKLKDQFGEQTFQQRRKHVTARLSMVLKPPHNGYNRFYVRTGINPELSPPELVEMASKFLHETNLELLEKIIFAIGSERTCQILCECEAMQKMGGLYTLDGKRKRTFGGVFIVMVKTDTRIDSKLRSSIFANNNMNANANANNKSEKPKNDKINTHTGDLDNCLISENDIETNDLIHKTLDDTSGDIKDPHSIATNINTLTNDENNINDVHGSTNNSKLINGSNDITVKLKSNSNKTNHKKRHNRNVKFPPMPVEFRHDNKYLYSFKGMKRKYNNLSSNSSLNSVNQTKNENNNPGDCGKMDLTLKATKNSNDSNNIIQDSDINLELLINSEEFMNEGQ